MRWRGRMRARRIPSRPRKAQASPRLENDFKRYHLNIWTEQAVRWLPLDAWDRGAASDWQSVEETLVGRRCFGGLDLSTTTDLTALALLFEPLAEGEPWISVIRAFMPEARMAERIRRDGVPYDRWHRAGALIATPGNVLDYDFVIAETERKAALHPAAYPVLLTSSAQTGLGLDLIRAEIARLID